MVKKRARAQRAGAMTDTTASPTVRAAQTTSFAVLFAIAGSHLINDMLQAVLPAIYPNLKSQFHLSFVQIGLVTLVFQCTASLLQPWVGYLADKKPAPYSLAIGMVATLAGSIRSITIGMAPGPSSPHRLASASPALSTSTTVAPAPSMCLAHSRPMPDAAPVTAATFPDSRCVMVVLFLSWAWVLGIRRGRGKRANGARASRRSRRWRERRR